MTLSRLFFLGALMLAAMASKAQQTQPPAYEIRKIAVLDRYANNNPDILFVTGESNFDTKLMYFSQSGGRLSAPKEFEQQIPDDRMPRGNAFNIISGRFTNDKYPDVIAIEYGIGALNGGLFLSVNHEGTFAPFKRLPDHLQHKDIWAGLMADVDGDNKPDLVGIVNSGGMGFKSDSEFVYAKNTTPEGADPHAYRFAPWKRIQIPEHVFMEAASEDIDGQGSSDLLLIGANPSGPIPHNRRYAATARHLGPCMFGDIKDVTIYSPEQTAKYGFFDDLDVGIFNGKKGVFQLYRYDLDCHMNSRMDEIYFIEKTDKPNYFMMGEYKKIN